MDTQHNEQASDIEEFERKAGELFSLMLALCDEKIAVPGSVHHFV